jgi:hypothetical protein
MQTQFICHGCTYTGQRRVATCPVCGTLMRPTGLDVRDPVRAGGPFAAVPFIP